ncbi:hypothetical protein PAPYR_9682 [Paratrimastix pyriformis]|uniref:Uncharacterized protein n=1 Tax=Paratrimastix pyriformis TaxID=342808 RepID=A0ABQ8U7T4_9EUKA|nr:hypothetical protein PAPYR_9682 [Paratrimastix pyriformis]
MGLVARTQTRRKVRVDEKGEWDAAGTAAISRQRVHKNWQRRRGIGQKLQINFPVLEIKTLGQGIEILFVLVIGSRGYVRYHGGGHGSKFWAHPGPGARLCIR